MNVSKSTSNSQCRFISIVLSTIVILILPAFGRAENAVPSWDFQAQPGMDQPYISSWRVIGAFDWTEAPVQVADTDHSDAVARQLNHPFIPELESSDSDTYVPSASGITATTVSATNGLVRLHRVLAKTRYQVAYAECNVISSVDQDAVLLPESDDGVKVWLDGKVVDEVDAIRRISQFEGYVRVHLNKGTNRLVVKLVRTRQTDIWDPWDFAVGLRSSEGALDEIAGRGVPHFLPNTIIRSGDPLKVDLSLFPAGAAVTLNLKQHDNQKEFTLVGGKATTVDLKNFSDGPIESTLESAGHRFTEPILYGSAEQFASHYKTQLSKYLSNDRNSTNLGALLIRFEHLMEPSYREHDSQLWQKKIAELSWQLDAIAMDIDHGQEPYKGKPGTWIRGFRSKVDGAQQYYIVHAPPQATSGKAFPLVIIVPYEEIPLRPFLYSIRVAEYSVLKLLDRAADRNGFGYVWADARGNTYGQRFGQAELLEALEAVERDYSIDPSRIYLFGVCSGALHAFSLAADHPDLFAALGGMSPVSRYQRVTIFDPPSPTDRYACDSLQRRSPILRLENLTNVPIMIVHGDEDTHNRISESQDLAREAQANGVPLTFLVEHGGTELRFPHDPRYTIFDFFKNKTLLRHPTHVAYKARSEMQNHAYWLDIDQFTQAVKPAKIEARIMGQHIDLETDNVAGFKILLDQTDIDPTSRLVVTLNGKTAFTGLPTSTAISIKVRDGNSKSNDSAVSGTLSDAFAEPFLAVIGTRDPGAREAMRQASVFVKTWQARFFTTPRIKLDTEITDLDVQDYNLVLFGTAQSNRILERVLPGLPLHYSDVGLSVADRSWQGSGYSIQAVFRNPLQPERYVVLAGDPECTDCRADALQFTLHGWYDMVIWQKHDNGAAQMASIGYFDRTSREFVPATSCQGAHSNTVARPDEKYNLPSSAAGANAEAVPIPNEPVPQELAQHGSAKK